MSKGAISSGTLTIGIFAIIVGLVGAYGIRTALLPQEQVAEAAPAKVVMPVAARDLPLDSVITESDVVHVTVTVEEQQERSPADGYMMMDTKFIFGSKLRRSMRQGETFSPSAFYRPGEGPNLADRLKPGFRSVAIEVEPANGASVPVGSLVDVTFRTFPRSGSDTIAAIPEMTMPLFEKIQVLDVKANDSGRGEQPAIVTLAVPSDRVAKINVVKGQGVFTLSARPAVELVNYTPDGDERLTLEEFLGLQPPAAAAPPMPQIPQHMTVIYRGADRKENTFGIVTPEYEQQLAQYQSVYQLQATTNKPGCKTCKKKTQGNGNYPLAPIPASSSSQYQEPNLLPPQPTRAVRPVDNVSDM